MKQGHFFKFESRPKRSMKLDTNYLSLRSIKSVFKAIKKKALNSYFLVTPKKLHKMLNILNT
jgi:hypothetical protein